ncbi:MAG: type II toxin-antitoxin system RelE/ParE family toxin [Candidatus Staskawiczbacteria bacterium]|nr:type II toxin-antitoxin system RelE/ParE family toxin [Candidatus Staskawiczbacteria bacterium]
MEIFLTKEFKENFACLGQQIQKRAEKQIIIFKNNPFYPSLHTEKLVPKSKEVWSFRVDKRYRIVFRFMGREKVVFLTVGPHDWIYKIKF